MVIIYTITIIVITTVGTTDWRPKVDAMTCSSPSYEHTGHVTRLAVSQDQAFFVLASHDGTCKVWETRQIEDSVGDLQSCLCYGGHQQSLSTVAAASDDMSSSSSRYAMASSSSSNNSSSGGDSSVRINDISIIENSHSVASGGSDGSVHVWRVDTISNTPQTQSHSAK